MSTSGNGSKSRPSGRKEVLQVGPFILGKTIGEGNSGIVKVGVHKDTGFKVAVKIINKQLLLRNQQMCSRVKRETVILKLLNHPNVLRVYEVFDTSAYIFIIMELVDGGDLFKYLSDRSTISDVENHRIFREIIAGVDYLHSLGICHRDLKVENILLDENRHVKIADLGISAVSLHGSLLSSSCGSPHYAAPEVIKGTQYNGMLADSWSCGVILYALLTNNLPFNDDNIRSLLQKVCRGTFGMPSFLPKPAKDLISKILVVNPDKRYTIDDIKKHAWFTKDVLTGVTLPPLPSLSMPEDVEPIERSEIDSDVLYSLECLSVGTPSFIKNELCKPGKSQLRLYYHILLDLKTPRDDLYKAKHHKPMVSEKFFAPEDQSQDGTSATDQSEMSQADDESVGPQKYAEDNEFWIQTIHREKTRPRVRSVGDKTDVSVVPETKFVNPTKGKRLSRWFKRRDSIDPSDGEEGDSNVVPVPRKSKTDAELDVGAVDTSDKQDDRAIHLPVVKEPFPEDSEECSIKMPVRARKDSQTSPIESDSGSGSAQQSESKRESPRLASFRLDDPDAGVPPPPYTRERRHSSAYPESGDDTFPSDAAPSGRQMRKKTDSKQIPHVPSSPPRNKKRTRHSKKTTSSPPQSPVMSDDESTSAVTTPRLQMSSDPNYSSDEESPPKRSFLARIFKSRQKSVESSPSVMPSDKTESAVVVNYTFNCHRSEKRTRKKIEEFLGNLSIKFFATGLGYKCEFVTDSPSSSACKFVIVVEEQLTREGISYFDIEFLLASGNCERFNDICRKAKKFFGKLKSGSMS